jgi:two-component system, NtrC family, nitrogen regulation response regulator NtrX
MKKTEKARILLVDDEEKILAALSFLLENRGYRVVATTDGHQALSFIEKDEVDAAIVDLVNPGMDGLTLLNEILARKPDFPVIMLTGHATIAKAVEATKLGAFDFLEKPAPTDKIVIVLENALARVRLVRERMLLLGDISEKYQMIGISKPLKDILAVVERAAPSDSRVLISGESGSGKELIARAIHLRSERAGKPFQIVNCAAIPEDLIESELFGHEKGAFTGAVQSRIGKFEAAGEGTLFLDEIGEMSPKVQAKVLRAIENKEIQRIGGTAVLTIDPRIIAASNRDLKQAVAAGNFREDLFYRLNVITIRVPPLRERKEDIPLLADHFLAMLCDERKRPLLRLHPSAMEALLHYEWPGNIRELRNLMEKLVVMSPQETISRREIEEFLQESAIGDVELSAAASASTLADARGRAEKDLIFAKLTANSWDYEKTADELNVSRATLFNKIRAYRIRRTD